VDAELKGILVLLKRADLLQLSLPQVVGRKTVAFPALFLLALRHVLLRLRRDPSPSFLTGFHGEGPDSIVCLLGMKIRPKACFIAAKPEISRRHQSSD
jgi:hypothetical protein